MGKSLRREPVKENKQFKETKTLISNSYLLKLLKTTYTVERSVHTN